jgi:hypothetical protein
MAGHRLYFLDASRHIAAREEFEADNDEVTIIIVHQRYNVAYLSAGL